MWRPFAILEQRAVWKGTAGQWDQNQPSEEPAIRSVIPARMPVLIHRVAYWLTAR